MELKKINPKLQKALLENGLTEPNELLSETFSTIKSGADCVLAAPQDSGKTTAIVISIIQKLEKASGESTRALVFVHDKERVIEMTALFGLYGNYTDLRVVGTHEKGDIDYDKNLISLGIDVLVGTPGKINSLFASAGFNMNTVKIFVVDDAEILFKNRMDAVIQRLAASIVKTQYLFTATIITERVEAMTEKIMTEPVFFETDD